MAIFRKNITFILLLIVLSIGGVFVGKFLFRNDEKIGFIKTKEVFADFEYKKQLEQNLKSIELKRQSIIDSLELELKMLAKQIELNKNDKDKITLFRVKRDAYIEKKNAFEKDHEEIVKKYDEQIIRQLNQYVKEFGQKNGYKFNYGADGSGSLMYADTTYNITKPIIQYLNKSFKGDH